jgi:hypothetical protein
MQEVRWLIAMDRWMTMGQGRRLKRPTAEDLLSGTPHSKSDGMLEAIRRVMPEF